MKLIDLDQCVIVPVVDGSRGGMRYEIQISIGELLKRSLEDFEPAVVDAVPVAWLEAHSREYYEDWGTAPVTVEDALKEWRKAQEVRT
jgi:hypothetical protein